MFSPCCMYNSGYKSPEKNKVKGPHSLKLGHPVLSLSLSIFLHSLTSSIQRISLDSAEAGTWHQTLFWGAQKSLQMVIAAMKLEDAYSLEEKL